VRPEEEEEEEEFEETETSQKSKPDSHFAITFFRGKLTFEK
jgi:hypothetical protein